MIDKLKIMVGIGLTQQFDCLSAGMGSQIKNNFFFVPGTSLTHLMFLGAGIGTQYFFQKIKGNDPFILPFK